MDKVIYNLVYNRKKRLNKKGMGLVQLEAYLNGRKKYFSTKVYLKPEQWDARKRLVKRHPNAGTLNRWLHAFLADIEQKELELWRQGRPLTLDLLKQLVINKENPRLFIPFCLQEIEAASLTESSKRNHRSTMEWLRTFRKNVTFSELSFEFVADFEHFLLKQGLHTNTVAKHLKHLKRYIHTAIRYGLLDSQRHAFQEYKIKTVIGKHSFLTPEELGKLEALRRTGLSLSSRKVLDAFLFCCYVGVRYSDFIQLSEANFVAIGQETWLVYKTRKTGVEVRLPLQLLFEGKSLAILQEYRNDLPTFFSLQDNSNVNKHLARIARLAGLDKRISFHTSRHTNATLLIYKGVNITTVQKLLGHKSVKTTQGYASIMDMTLVEDLKRAADISLPSAETQAADL